MDIIALRLIDSHKIPGVSLALQNILFEDCWHWGVSFGIGAGVLKYSEMWEERSWSIGFDASWSDYAGDIHVALGPWRWHWALGERRAVGAR